MRRLVVPLAAVGVTASLVLTPGGRAAAQDDGTAPPTSAPSTSAPPPTLAPPVAPVDEDAGPVPLVPVPSGCVTAELPDVVFVGRLVDRDFRTGRFEIEQVRAGDAAPFAVDGLIDVRYGLDAQYLDEGEHYLVSAERDDVLGVLVSKVTAAVPDFGGDDVIGVTESDVQCPPIEDAIVTLRPDGSTVDSGVLTPLFEERRQVLGAVLLPLGVAFAVVFALAMLRLALSGVAAGVSSVSHRRSR